MFIHVLYYYIYGMICKNIEWLDDITWCQECYPTERLNGSAKYSNGAPSSIPVQGRRPVAAVEKAIQPIPIGIGTFHRIRQMANKHAFIQYG